MIFKPICIGCNKHPQDLDDFFDWKDQGYKDADAMCIDQEGTLNPENGHFLCTPCYIKAGMPANHHPQPNWVAP